MAAQSRPIGQDSAPTATPTPSAITVDVGKGQINGTDDQFLGGIAVENGDGDYANGGEGPTNSIFTGPTGDQIACLASMYNGPNQYHIHAFLGIYYNGQEIAMPDGLGMAAPDADGTYNGPGGPIYNWTDYTYNPQNRQEPGCFYKIHSHDASGVIHVESDNPNNLQRTQSMFTLGDLFALWGVTFDPKAGTFGPFSGKITIYYSGNRSLGGPNGTHVTKSNLYKLYTGSINQIHLYSHQVTWILIGSGNPTGSSLPNVSFWTGEEW